MRNLITSWQRRTKALIKENDNWQPRLCSLLFTFFYRIFLRLGYKHTLGYRFLAGFGAVKLKCRFTSVPIMNLLKIVYRIVLKQPKIKLYGRQYNDIALGKVPGVTAASIKKTLTMNGFSVEEGFTCFAVKCLMCKQSKSNTKARLYINKTTGKCCQLNRVGILISEVCRDVHVQLLQADWRVGPTYWMSKFVKDQTRWAVQRSI